MLNVRAQKLELKSFGGKTFLAKYPDMSNVEFTDIQKAEQSLFADAIAYVKSIINDPEKKAAFKATLEPGKRV